jgi:hypothetical protein
MKCSVLYKEDCLRLYTYLYAFLVGDSVKRRLRRVVMLIVVLEEVREKEKQISSTQAHVTIKRRSHNLPRMLVKVYLKSSRLILSPWYFDPLPNYERAEPRGQQSHCLQTRVMLADHMTCHYEN